MEVNATSYNVNSTTKPVSSYGNNFSLEIPGFKCVPEYIIEVLDIPNFNNSNVLLPIIYVAVAAKSGEFRPLQLEYTDNPEGYLYPYIESITEEATMGMADCLKLSCNASAEIIDYKSSIRVFLTAGNPHSITEVEMVGKHDTNLAVVGNELIQFMIVRRVGDNEFVLSGLKRGCLGTEHLIGKHKNKFQRFVLLNKKIHSIELPIHVYKNICKYRILDSEEGSYKNNEHFI